MKTLITALMLLTGGGALAYPVTYTSPYPPPPWFDVMHRDINTAYRTYRFRPEATVTCFNDDGSVRVQYVATGVVYRTGSSLISFIDSTNGKHIMVSTPCAVVGN